MAYKIIGRLDAKFLSNEFGASWTYSLYEFYIYVAK